VIARSIDLVLFDLDGTMADTAPDLAAVANRQRQARGLAPLPLAELRPLASQGARGLIGRALGVAPGEPDFETLKQEFFTLYEGALCVRTALFAGIDSMLEEIERRGIKWGIVTNKIARFTEPLVRQLGLAGRAACIVSGDTTPHPKPHPAPLLHAATLAGCAAGRCAYVGDDLRDVQAGRAAGMVTVIAAYGYLGGAADLGQWNGDHVIDAPARLLDLLPPAG
jgi:2-phosphoglycolate phosphatase